MNTAVRTENLQLRVVSDAIMGGGLDLRAGQVVSVSDLGRHAERLLAYGAIEPMPETDASDHDLDNRQT